jgi:hypothetical protein
MWISRERHGASITLNQLMSGKISVEGDCRASDSRPRRLTALRSTLQAETAIWAASDGTYLAGRADAVSVVRGEVQVVLDWKGDVAPSAQDRAGYRGQLAEYLAATGALRGALVYMSLGQIEWVEGADGP